MVISLEDRDAGAILGSIPELVEIIIFNLPVQTILLAQRVSWTWRNIITSSEDLQTALFLKPTRTAAVEFRQEYSVGLALGCTSKENCDPAVRREYHSRYNYGKWRWVDSGWAFRGTLWLNPFVKYPISLHKLIDLVEDPDIVLSCNRMLLTWPPVTEMLVNHGETLHWHRLKASDPKIGITVRDLYMHMYAFGMKFARVFQDALIGRYCYEVFEHPMEWASAVDVLEIITSAEHKKQDYKGRGHVLCLDERRP